MGLPVQAHIRQLQVAARAHQELEVVRAERDGLEKETRRLAKEMARDKELRCEGLTSSGVMAGDKNLDCDG